MAGGLLTSGQQRFVGTLSHETGLDPRVVGAWALAEQSGGAARGYEGRGYNNWLNIANTDSGPASGAHSGVWRDPVSAARATAEWLRGSGPITHEYGRAAPGILSILRAGRDPMAQIHAIASSGWASSGYNGGADLRSLYGELAGLKLPPGGGGSVGGGAGGLAAPGGGQGGGQGESEAQTNDLMQLIDLISQGKQGASTSVEGIALPKPAEQQAQAGPKVPQDLSGAGSSTDPSQLLALIAKLGEDGSAEPGPSAVGGGSSSPAALGGGGASHEVNPLPGFTLGRTDMGVDANAKPGTPIRAIGNGRVLGIQPNWYAGQPYLYYEVLNERGQPKATSAFPDAGKIVYVAEQIDPTVKPGDLLRAGQTIGRYASSGTGIESGLGSRGWQTQAQAEGRIGTGDHSNAPAGIRFRQILARLGAH